MSMFQKKDENMAVKEKKPLDFKKTFDNDNYGPGLRAVIILALAVAICVGIILIVNALPTQSTGFDISYQKIHSISDETYDMIRNLDEDVDVYYICQKGNENLNTQYMLNLYADGSDKITVTALDPAFQLLDVQALVGMEQLDDNTVIVKQKEMDRSQVLKFDDFFDGGVFALEDYMNAAINFVTGKTSRHAYQVVNHGEIQLEPDVVDYIGLDGFEFGSIGSLKDDKALLDDCDCLIINGPSKDFTQEEVDIVLDYLENGGNLLYTSVYTTSTLPNLDKITSYYNANLGRGLVMESDANRVYDENPINLMPNIYSSGDDALTSGVESIVCPSSMPIVITEDKNVKVTKILETTENSYSAVKNIFTNTTETQEGPFVIGAKFEKGNSKMIWYSCCYLSDMGLSEVMGGGNLILYLNSVSTLGSDQEISSIYGKTVSTQYLTINDSKIGLWRTLMIFVIPGLVIIAGIYVIIRRKRR